MLNTIKYKYQDINHINFLLMQNLSKQSQQVYQQIDQNCGFTAKKKQINRIYTSHIQKLQQKIKQLKQTNISQMQQVQKLQQQTIDLKIKQDQQDQKFKQLRELNIKWQEYIRKINQEVQENRFEIQYLNKRIMKQTQSSELQISLLNKQISNIKIQCQELIELFNVAKYLQHTPPIYQKVSKIPQLIQSSNQNQITVHNIHDYNFLAQFNTYYQKQLKEIRTSAKFNKTQHIDKVIPSNKVLKIDNISQLYNFDLNTINYQYLIQLNVSNSMLSDNHSQIFSKWYQLQLKKLDLSGNNITDKFIINIQNSLVQLTRINLAFTDITNESIKIIGYLMKECRGLDASYTKINQTGIQYIIILDKLEQLSIWSGQQHPNCYDQYLLKDYEPNLIRYKKNIIKISQYGIMLLSKMKLTKLTVNLDQQDGNRILHSNKKSAKYLYLNAKMDNKLIMDLLQINKLTDMQVTLKEILVLEQVQRGKKGKISVDQLKKYLQGDQIILEEIEIIDEIGYLKGQEILKEFKLTHYNKNYNKVIQTVKNLKWLTSLQLSYISIKNQGAIQIARNLKNLTNLTLIYNHIGYQGIIQITENLKNLKNLNLTWNIISQKGVIQIANKLKFLISLNLSKCYITKQGVIQIARNLGCLTSLSLQYNDIGDQEASQIARNMKFLTNLNLSNNRIEDGGAIQIAKNLRYLTNLNLGENRGIGKEGSIQIVRNLKYLTNLTLHISYVDSLDEQFKQFIRNRIKYVSF